MSHACTHDEARLGNFAIHDNGSVFWADVHHMSWIDDDNKRVYAPQLSVLCTAEEAAQCQQLADQHDKAVK
jgi:hypothetical protein